MADNLELEVATPERELVRELVSEVQVPGKNGYMGILPGHAPLITELSAGELSYRQGGNTHCFVVAWGFAEVLPDRVTILAETAEPANEIDVNRAQADKKHAEQSLADGKSEEDFVKAGGELKYADARLEVALKK